MGRARSANIRITLTGFAIMLLGVVLKILCYQTGSLLLNLLRSLLYLLFFALWALSLNQRIIQKASKRILMMIAASELVWILFRTLRYEILKTDFFQRYLWYCYYLPNLMIPSLCLMLAVSMRKSERYRLPKKLLSFPVISVLLFLLVLTNDAHQAVFLIPPGPDGTEVGFYTYGWGYFVITAYMVLCALACYGIILAKCRIRVGKFGRIVHFLPLIPLAVGIAVCVWYVMGKVVLFGFYHLDITVFICYLTTATLEMCIQSGLIMSNTGYNELFSVGSLRAVITDENFGALVASSGYSGCGDYTDCGGCGGYGGLSKDDMRRAKDAPVMLQNGMRLSCSAIKGGNVLWQDDLEELQKILRMLSEKKDYLQSENAAIQQANSYQKKERQLIEKNRLYNQILTQTKTEIERYAALVEELNAETDSERSKRLALKLAFVGTFIKRHDNLVFLNEMESDIAPAELSYCVEESLSNLRLGGITCFCSYSLARPIPYEKMSRMYEAFYRVILERIERLSSVCVYLIEENEAAIIIRISCVPDCDAFSTDAGNIKIEKENGEWVVEIT